MSGYDRQPPGSPIPRLRSVIINTASVIPVAVKHMLIDDITFLRIQRPRELFGQLVELFLHR